MFFKKAHEWIAGWRSVLRKGRDPMKERNKQKREAITIMRGILTVFAE
ncbi:hypothetical protein ABID23_000995 [Bartonella silvatica]|uniref:Transposase n=1 Tax=Bartonella silvatica TaxID=357760 RepID=A0ABV2HHN5_9HYPH